MHVYKFSSSATEKAPTVTKDELIKLMKSGNRYHSAMSNLLQGTYKINGWAFDIREDLNRYVYLQYGSWAEAYAPNKTTLRKLIHGRIDNITEVQE